MTCEEENVVSKNFGDVLIHPGADIKALIKLVVPIRINCVLIDTRRVLHKLRCLLANNWANGHDQTGRSASKTSKHSNHADTALNAPRLQAAHNRVQTQSNENSAGHPTHQGTHIVENVVGKERQTHANGS